MSETAEGVETEGIDFKVKTQSGTEYELKNVLPDTTVLQIKEQVAKQDGTLTPVQIKLLYRGKVLGNNQDTVKSLELKNNTVLFFVKNLNPEERVFVVAKKLEELTIKTQSGAQFTLRNIEPSTTVHGLKEMIHEQDEKFTPTGIKLIFKGKPLTDVNAKVEELEIPEGATLFMVKQLDNKKLENESTSKEDAGITINTEPAKTVRFRVPVSGPGNLVTVTAPNGATFRVRVPRTSRVGDMMQVQIPENLRSFRRPNNTTNNAPATGNQRMMQVVCPPNTRPGQSLEVTVPGQGRMRVTIPQNVYPGQTFRFRVPN